MHPEDFEESNESVEDALTRLLSAGFGETNDEDFRNVIGDVASTREETSEPEPAGTESEQ